MRRPSGRLKPPITWRSDATSSCAADRRPGDRVCRMVSWSSTFLGGRLRPDLRETGGFGSRNQSPLSLAEGTGQAELIRRSPSASESPIEYEYRFAEYEFERKPEQRNEPGPPKPLRVSARALFCNCVISERLLVGVTGETALALKRDLDWVARGAQSKRSFMHRDSCVMFKPPNFLTNHLGTHRNIAG